MGKGLGSNWEKGKALSSWEGKGVKEASLGVKWLQVQKIKGWKG